MVEIAHPDAPRRLRFSTGTWTYGFSPLVASADCGDTSLAVALCPGAPCYDDPTAAGPLNVTCLCPVGREEVAVVVVVVPCGVCGPPPLRAALLRAPRTKRLLTSESDCRRRCRRRRRSKLGSRSSEPVSRPRPPHALLARRHVIVFLLWSWIGARMTRTGFRSTPSARRPARRST